MNRLFFLFAALVAALTAPVTATGLAAPPQHCDQASHSAPANDMGSATGHQACCVAIDPARLGNDGPLSGTVPAAIIWPGDDSLIARNGSGTDPPPPRVG